MLLLFRFRLVYLCRNRCLVLPLPLLLFLCCDTVWIGVLAHCYAVILLGCLLRSNSCIGVSRHRPVPRRRSLSKSRTKIFSSKFLKHTTAGDDSNPCDSESEAPMGFSLMPASMLLIQAASRTVLLRYMRQGARSQDAPTHVPVFPLSSFDVLFRTQFPDFTRPPASFVPFNCITH